MEIPFSEKVFFMIARYVRDICKKHVKFDDFVSASGFVCLDVDGKTQHRFILNEIVDKTNNGDGNSVSLSAMNWGIVKKFSSSKKEMKGHLKKPAALCSPGRDQENSLDEGETQTALKRRNSSFNKPTEMPKSLSGPVSHQTFTKGRNKMVNRTFTRSNMPLQAHKDVSPGRTFSNSTVNISKADAVCYKGITRSPTFDFNKEKQTELDSSGINNHNVHQDKQNNLKVRNSKLVPQKTRSKKVNSLEHHLTHHYVKHCDQELSTHRQACQQKLSKREDSDISIGSTRPKYLVQHNDELLLPCPKLRTSSESLSITDSNFIQNINLNQAIENLEEGTVVSSAHISFLVNSIITAISRPSSRNFSEVENEISELQEERNVEDYDKISPPDSLTSSVEIELPTLANQSEIAIHSLRGKQIHPTKKISSISSISQQLSNTSCISKKKSKVFKWMKLFRRD
ncbi:uncharacterized protein LOC131955017 isoform X2 [Physella acuta]|uniref:uncharacterized protein LOC131955017 isoform X2 n=1 Tax=Physella acuta TaxID=109671 RepID=UPI0027DDDA61|nr:uncharacterized protein LOC131955017 isoform X2 [Physella acuta]